MGQLTATQLIRLEAHKYSCQSTSFLDPHLQGWWNWLVKKCPRTLAPNLITMMGLVINIVTALILMFYSPDAKHSVPSWACFLCAFGLFVYQSLDAIDGKQARRTDSSSPLGELFDHGCDSLSTIMVSLSVACAVELGTHPFWMFVQCLMAGILFYCAHWQTFVSGTLRFGYIDVTEAQFIVIIVLLVSTVFGSEFWSLQVPFVGLAAKCLPTVLGSAAGSIALFNNFRVILIERGAGRNGSTVADTSVLSPFVPLFLFVAPAITVAYKSPSKIYIENPILYLMTFGLVMARITNRLVVAHMTKSEMAYTDSSMFGPLALLLNQYFSCIIPENILLWIVYAYVLLDFLKYCREVCLEICNHLNIMLFRIVPHPHGSRTEKIETSKYYIRSRGRLSR